MGEFCVVLPKAIHCQRLWKKPCGRAWCQPGGIRSSRLEDDDNATQAILVLERFQCVPVVHADAKTAIAFLSAHELIPQAIVADYRLQDSLTGIDAIESVRAKYGRCKLRWCRGAQHPKLHDELQLDYTVLQKLLAPASIKNLLRTFRLSGSGSEGITQ
jgi:hypothetical protein